MFDAPKSVRLMVNKSMVSERRGGEKGVRSVPCLTDRVHTVEENSSGQKSGKNLEKESRDRNSPGFGRAPG